MAYDYSGYDDDLPSRVTFWELYKQAMIFGEYGRWRRMCERAKRQGLTYADCSNACTLALLTNLSIPLLIFGAIYGSVSLFFWVLERLA